MEETGLEPLLDAWGLELPSDLVWDQEANYLTIPGEGRIQYPFWVNVAEGGMERSVPATGGLPGCDLFWVHPVRGAAPEGLEHTSLVRSSANSWAVDANEAMVDDNTTLNARGVELLATEPGRPRDLMRVVTGRFPSAFTAGAPAARDAIADGLWREERRAALEGGREPPPRPTGSSDEPVASGGEGGAVVLVGDADWISDAYEGKLFGGRNRLLFENVVDWLLLEERLVALRATLPRQRRIADFLAEEKEARGLPVLEGTGALALEGVDPKKLSAAEAAAERRRWLHMAAATGLSLVLALGLAFLGRWVLTRAVPS